MIFFPFCGFCLKYHGGTNFGRTAGGPFITTSYDYDAPIDEYGTYIYIFFQYREYCVFPLFDLIFCFAIFVHHFGEKLGLVRQPKWGHLKELHKAIKQCENTLLFGNSKLLTFGPLQEVNYFDIWFSF